jgi:lysophospholipase-2
VFQEDRTEWFYIYSLSDTAAREELQAEGLKEGVKIVAGLVEEEMRCLRSAGKVVLGRVSQGNATALRVFICGGCSWGGWVGGFRSENRWKGFAGGRQKRGEVSEFY